jgi:acyl-CoA thioester hydrolase
MITYETPVLAEWVDYNGHLRDAYYLLIFSYATDAFMPRIGLDVDQRGRKGHSLFTLEAHINYLHEVKLGRRVRVDTRVIGHDHKRVHLYHSLLGDEDESPLAVSEQMLLHVTLEGPAAAPFGADSHRLLTALVQRQTEQNLPPAKYLGRVIALPASGAPASWP